MTIDAPKTEREEALEKWAMAFVADVEARGGIPPLHVSGDAMHDICRALLSSSRAEGEMREALTEVRAEIFGTWGESTESTPILDFIDAALSPKESGK